MGNEQMTERTITFIIQKERKTVRLWVYSQGGMKTALVSAFPRFEHYPAEFSSGQITDNYCGLSIVGKYEINHPAPYQSKGEGESE